ncbi:MAG: bile acid:sodium symporter family protein [Lysobacterales bacterium]|jgi:BASS family bile acid:Na+ symporter
MFLKLFPLWAPLAAAIGLLFAEPLADWRGAIVPLLTVVMLCMGLTLTPRDFVRVGRYRFAFLTGLILQFTVMPLMAVLIATIFRLGPDLTVGLVLVGSVAGGTSSNVMTFLARGNVALSVAMTATSTLAGVVMTPLLLSLLVGSTVDVPAGDMLLSLFRIVLLPVALGVTLNAVAGRYVRSVLPALAPLAVLAILVIIAIVVGLNAKPLRDVGLSVVLATLLHNVSGLALGYFAAKLMRFEPAICRTIALEVGMQNSGLATALALKFFSSVTALPGAIFSVWLNITGSVFASLSARRQRAG